MAATLQRFAQQAAGGDQAGGLQLLQLCTTTAGPRDHRSDSQAMPSPFRSK
jgi:hypothetical protein